MRTLYTNGTVITMDHGRPQAEALVTEGNRIVGIGNEQSMKALAGNQCELVDMQGGALYPGFNETHNHLSLYAIFRQYAYLGNQESITGVITTLKEHHRTHPLPFAEPMIVGYAYDDTNLKDGRQITRHDLDKVSDTLPVIVYHISMHLGFLNTKALQLFGFSEDSEAELGGVIHKEESGFPTGRLDEMSWFNTGAKLESPTPERYLELLKEAVEEFNQAGFTGVHDAGIGLDGMPHDVVNSYRTLAKAGDLDMRVFASAIPDVYDELEKIKEEQLAESYFMLGGVKLFLDGSIQGETAALLEPYAHDHSLQGELIMDEAKFRQLVLRHHTEGNHISVHANGDLTIETVLQAFEVAQAKFPRADSRHMIIHAQMAHPDHIARMKAANVIPSFFGMHVHNWGDRHFEIFLGEERATRINPAGEAEAMGLAFTLHVDTPVLPPQAILSIHTAVNRLTKNGRTLGEDQKIRPYSAVGAYTNMAALCSSSEKVRGTLSVGKLADLTLLSQDVLTCQPLDIANTTVLRTVLGGKTVYQTSS